MGILFSIVGALLGAWLMDEARGLFGFVAGLIVGWLLHRLLAAEVTLRKLASRIDLLEQRNAATAKPVSEATPQPAAAPKRMPEAPRVSVYEPAPASEAIDAASAAVRTPESAADRADIGRKSDPRPGIGEHTIGVARRWLTTGNVPVKVGVIISFFGVAFLLKYAAENQVFSIPMSVRYLAVAAFAAALLVIGWRMRNSNRVYGLSLQGGGIGVLYLTVFAAFQLHGLLPPTLAFALLVLITLAAGVLAIKQESRAFAILGTTGGFLAPLLASTGSGNHVALFSYYLIVNCAVLGVAWYRPWRELNVIGFVFTFGVGTIWGYQYYVPELFASTQPFLVSFFLFYTAIAVLFAFRQRPNLRGYVDGTLLFGTPTIAFALQSQLLRDSDNGLAISAAVVSVFYAALAFWLWQKRDENFALLKQAFVALAVAFGTIAVPLALDDRSTAIAWVLEGAALVWIGVRQNTTLAKLTGAALAFAGGVKFMQYGWSHDLAWPLFNGNAMGGALIAVSSLFSARLLRTDEQRRDWQKFASLGLLFWGLAWWFGTGVREIDDRVASSVELHANLVFLCLSFAGLAFAGRYRDWIAYRRVALALLPFLVLLALGYLLEFEHFFTGLGTLAWIVAIAAHLWIMHCYGDASSRAAAVAHAGGALFFTLLLAKELAWQVDLRIVSDVWSTSAGLLVIAGGAFLLVTRKLQQAWPLNAWPATYAASAAMLTALFAGLLLVASINDPGNPEPITYVPLLNPFDMLSIICVALVWRVLSEREQSDRVGAAVIGGIALLLSTLMVVRAVHHFSGVAWDADALMRSVGVQSTLSIYWAILGLGGMVLGARRTERLLWMCGAALMAVVVLKLFVIDLGNTGTVERIISFLGVGIMLLLVGYFSPVPPRTERANEQ